MPIKKVIAESGLRPIKIWTDDVEKSAELQLLSLASLPGLYKHVAVMPDVHAGRGATIGTVIATEDVLIPSAVGVDIGCGMAAVETNLTSWDFRTDSFADTGSLKALRRLIERVVPVGPEGHDEPVEAAQAWAATARGPALSPHHLKQLGTLGGGNHFIELCVDEKDHVWVLLHSGSRNLGKTIAQQHITKAKRLMEQYHIRLADPELAYLARGTKEFDAYLSEMHFAQDYASENRVIMLGALTSLLRTYFPHVESLRQVNCHHNYVATENHFGKNIYVTRKGAIRARVGDLGIIPGSMGTPSYIVRGLGNPEAFESAAHGAGRRMSRKQARLTFTRDEFIAQTAGVECRSDTAVLDEIPGSYKDIDAVMANQDDLVAVESRLKQFLCVKGD